MEDKKKQEEIIEKQQIKILIRLAIMAIVGLIGIRMIIDGNLFFGIAFSLLLPLLPWVYRGENEESEFEERIQNFRKERTRLIVCGILGLVIIVGLGIRFGTIIKHNIEENRQEQQRIERKQAERERQEAIEEEKRNTPKPEIIIHNTFDEVLSGTTVIVDFEVSDATEIYIQDDLVPTTELGQHSEEVDLDSPETTLNIKAKNKYWETEEKISIVREKTADEVEAERIAKEKETLRDLYGDCIFYSDDFCYIYLSEAPYISHTNAKKDCEERDGRLTTQDDIEKNGDELGKLIQSSKITHIRTRETQTIYGRVYGLNGYESNWATKDSDKRSYVGYFCVTELKPKQELIDNKEEQVMRDEQIIKETRKEMIYIYQQMKKEHNNRLGLLAITEYSPGFSKIINRIQDLRDKINPYNNTYENKELNNLQWAIWGYSVEIASITPGWYDSDNETQIKKAEKEVEKLIK